MRITALQSSIGNRRVSRLVRSNRRSGADAVQRQTVARPSSLRSDVIDEYQRVTQRIAAVNQAIPPTATRQGWVRTLGHLWVEAGNPGTGAARLRGLLRVLADIEGKIQAEYERARAEWQVLRAQAAGEIAEKRQEADAYNRRAMKILRRDLRDARRRVDLAGQYLTRQDFLDLRADVEEGRHYVAAQTYIERKDPFHGVGPDRSLGNAWIGLGTAVSGDMFVAGRHSTTATMVNVGAAPPLPMAVVTVSGWKFGPGLGGSTAAVLVLAQGPEDFGDLDSLETSGMDYSVALGGRLGSALKAAGALPHVISAADDLVKARDIARHLIAMGLGQGRGLEVLPIPLAGVGMHVWAGYKSGDVEVVDTGLVGDG